MSTQTRNQNSGTLRALLFCIAALMCMSAIAMPVMAAGLADTPWPKFQNNNKNTGLSPYTGPQTANIVWNYTASSGFSRQNGVAIGSDGTLYISNYGDKNLHAINPDGTLKWKYPAAASLFGVPAIGSDGTIYFTSDVTRGNLTALNPDGSMKWNYNTGKTGSYIDASPAIGSDGTIYITQNDKNITAINPDGTRKWNYVVGGNPGINSAAIGSDGTVYTCINTEKAIYAMNADGTFKWKYTFASSASGSPAIGSDGTIYVGSQDQNLTALNPDGTLKWKYFAGGTLSSSGSSPAVGTDGTVYFGSNDNKLYAVNPDGTLKWTYTTGGYVQSTPVIGADGTIYFGSHDYKIYALNADGTLKWNYTTGGTVYTTAAMGSDGTLYIGSSDNKLYAFRDAAAAAPVAAFSGTPTSGTAPLTVIFTDASTNNPTSWLWDFGDSDTTNATGQNPVHTYAAAGTYTVTLTATNAAGSDDETKTGYITVTAPTPPVAGFAADVVTGPAPLAVQFTDQSYNATAWAWDFEDDGTIDNTTQSPVHTYSAAGTYAVNLTVTGSGGSDSEVKSGYITVSSASRTWYVDATGAGDFTSVQPAINAASPGDTISIRPGTYTAEYGFSVADTSDLTILGESTDSVTLTSPEYSFGIDSSSGIRVENITFLSTSVYIAGGSNNVIAHNVIEPPTWNGIDLYASSTNTIRDNLIIGAPGEAGMTVFIGMNNLIENNTIRNCAHDGLVIGSRENTIVNNSVINNAGSAVVIYTEGDTENNRIYLNTFTGNGATVSTWDTTPPAQYWVSPRPVSYTYNGNTYSGILGNFWDADYTGTDADGNGVGDTAYTVPESLGSDTAPLMGAWNNGAITGSGVVAPVAAFSGTPTSGTEPLTVTFTDASTNTPTSWLWDFGDGNATNATEQNPVHTYAAAGTYTVNLTATNAGGSDTASQAGYITVLAGAQPDFLVRFVNANSNCIYTGGALFARETNIVRSTVKNNGTAASPAAVLRVTASDGFTGTGTIPALAAGAQAYVDVEDTTIRPTQNVTVTFTSVADPDNLVPEAFEGNNAKDSAVKTVKYNGYKGKAIYWEGGSNVTTHASYDLRGNLIHSFGDGAYRSGSFGSGWYSYNTTWTGANLPIPDGATVREARLYVPYTWDYEQRAPDQITVAFNDVPVPYQHWYHDVSNFGAYSTHTYGLMTYDVTTLFAANSNNVATLTRPGYMDTISPYGFTLAVVYEDQNATRKQIFMNEEFDLLGAASTGYATTPEEATAYIPFTGQTIDTANVTTANLVTFVPSGYGPEGNLLFNGNVIDTTVWDFGSSQGSQVAVDTRDIKTLLAPTGNVAGIQGNDMGGSSPCLAASQQFLIVEYPDEVIAPVADFSADPTSGTAPLTVTFTDLSTNTPTEWLWDFGDDDFTNQTEQNPVHTYSATGTYNVTLTATNSAGSDSEEKTGYITVTTGIIPLPGYTNPPTDPDSDGLYEDLNANDRKDFNDLQLYYAYMSWIEQNEPVAYFDYNCNGRIDFNDLQLLYADI